MFKLLEPPAGHNMTLTIDLDGRSVSACAGETVASVILRENEAWCRTTPISHARRGPYCMIGVCFDCLMSIDGVGVVRSCQTYVHVGMKVRRQNGARVLTPSC